MSFALTRFNSNSNRYSFYFIYLSIRILFIPGVARRRPKQSLSDESKQESIFIQKNQV